MRCVLQVRYDRSVGPETAVKFMTDGILLRELQSDLLLRSYSVLVLDEVHERSLNTDLLLGELPVAVCMYAWAAAAGQLFCCALAHGRGPSRQWLRSARAPETRCPAAVVLTTMASTDSPLSGLCLGDAISALACL